MPRRARLIWRQDPVPDMANETSASSTRGVDFWKGGSDLSAVHSPERVSVRARPARQSRRRVRNGRPVEPGARGRPQLRLELRPDCRRRRGRHRRQPGWRRATAARSGRAARPRTCAASTRAPANCSGPSTSSRTHGEFGARHVGQRLVEALRRSRIVVLRIGGRSSSATSTFR